MSSRPHGAGVPLRRPGGPGDEPAGQHGAGAYSGHRPSGLLLYDSLTQQEKEEGRGIGGTANLPNTSTPSFRRWCWRSRGNDVFYSAYKEGTLLSTAAAPIVYRDMTIGAIYIRDRDETQGALLMNLQQNLRTISLVLAVIALAVSALFSRVLTARIGGAAWGHPGGGRGEYGHRLQPAGEGRTGPPGRGSSISSLTAFQTTEEVRRRFVSDASHELKTPLASIRLLADSIPSERGDGPGDSAGLRLRHRGGGRPPDPHHRASALPHPAGQPAGGGDPDRGPGRCGQAGPVHAGPGGRRRPGHGRGQSALRLHPAVYRGRFVPDLLQSDGKRHQGYNLPGGKVFVSVCRDGDQVLLEVADTGIGIPEEELPKVFNRFYRVDKARSRAAGGTGLGLSIVRDTVRRHGGWITAQRRQPEGSVFTAGFPARLPR